MGEDEPSHRDQPVGLPLGTRAGVALDALGQERQGLADDLGAFGVELAVDHADAIEDRRQVETS